MCDFRCFPDIKILPLQWSKPHWYLDLRDLIYACFITIPAGFFVPGFYGGGYGYGVYFMCAIL